MKAGRGDIKTNRGRGVYQSSTGIRFDFRKFGGQPRQKELVVLKSADLPSILVESAFITNRNEAKLLKSKKFQKRLARLLADGISEYATVDGAQHLRVGD